MNTDEKDTDKYKFVDYCSDEHVRLMQEGWTYVHFLDHPTHMGDLIIKLQKPENK